MFLIFFFFNDTATTEIYTLSLHDALPISDGAGADDGDCVPQFDFAVESANLVSCGQDVAEHHRSSRVHACSQGIQAVVGMGDAYILGLGAIDQMPQNPAAIPAMGIDAALTVVATPAGGDAGNQHLVANLDVTYAVTHFFDHSDAFVAESATFRDRWHIAFQNVQVGAANGGMGDAHYGICGFLDCRLRLVFPAALTWPVKYQCFHNVLSLKGARLQMPARAV